MKRILSLYSLIAILIAAGTVNLHAQNVVVDKSSLTFSAQFGGPAVSQSLNVTSSGAAIDFFTFSNAAWVKVNGVTSASGRTPSSVTVSADPTGLNAGTYNTTVSVFGGANSVSVNITLTVSTIGVSPGSITFGGYTFGSVSVPLPQTITLSGAATAFTAAASTTSGGAWLQALPTSGNSPGAITAALNTTIVPGLAVGTYNGKITITPAGAGTIPVDIPVTLTVSAVPVVSVSPTPLQFNIQTGGTNNITSQLLTIGVAPAAQVGFGFTASVDPNPAGKNWILINPPNGNTDVQTGLAQVTVSVDTTGLPANTYNGTITLITPNGAPAQTSIPVKLVVSSSPLLNIPAAPVTFNYQLGAAKPADQTVNVTATSGSLAYTVAVSANTPWLSATANGSTAAPFAVSVNPSGLTPGTYNGSVTVTGTTAGSGTQQIPVILKVTNDPSIVTNFSSLAFPFQIGQATPASQLLKVSSSTGAPINIVATISQSTCPSSAWLLVNGSATVPPTGPTDTSIVVSVNPVGLPVGTCTAKITLTGAIVSTGAAAPNSPLEIPVTLYISNSPLLVVTPTLPLAFNAALGAQTVAPQTVTLSSTSSAAADQLNYNVTFQTATGGSWLFVGPLAGTTASNNVLTISVIPSLLSAGTYTGTVTVNATTSGGAAVANSPLIIPVSLTVTSGTFTLSSTQLNFSSAIGGSAPAAQTVNIGSSGAALTYTAVAATGGTQNWLSVTPASGITGTNPTLSVTANPANLTAGTYNGTITVTSPNASPAVINVTLVVQAGTISAPTTTLTFNQLAGGTAPAAQAIAVTGTPAGLNFTATTSTNTLWLTVSPASGATPGSVQVTANAGSLAAGQYTGSVIITSTGAAGSPITVPVILNVNVPQTLSANPPSLTFTHTTGLAAPAAQNVVVNITGAVSPINALVQANPATPWLQVSPASASATPATFSVSVTPGSLAAGTYTGAINFISPNSLTPLSVSVTLNVSTVPRPVINVIKNAASFVSGAISPGENLFIEGTGIGPATLVVATPSGGSYGTTLSNTRVLFDGIPSPVYYASSGQTSVFVPYGLSGRAVTNVVVEYSGVASAPAAYNVAPAAPGIYTLNSAGTGPGAVLNQDGITVNGAAAPAAKGSVISVYMTGEGQTSPAGVDGAIIPPDASALKYPVLPVTATINGIEATVVYAGSAPTLISGAMQVNIRIPDNAPTGAAVPLVVRVGTASSQPGVTISVQ